MNRRSFLTTLACALAAPAIIRTPGLLMPVKVLDAGGWLTENTKVRATERLLFGVDDVRSWIAAPGEYIIPAEVVAKLGGGDVLLGQDIIARQLTDARSFASHWPGFEPAGTLRRIAT